MKKIINKGYTLHDTSWENDGDNYRTKSKTVPTKEEAEYLHKIFTELFKSCNNGEGGVGNSMEGEENQTILDYVNEHKNIFTDLSGEDEDGILGYFDDLSYQLMGGSEFYDFRVCESVVVTYSPEDVYLETINF